jgi:hypothetical protein
VLAAIDFDYQSMLRAREIDYIGGAAGGTCISPGADLAKLPTIVARLRLRIVGAGGLADLTSIDISPVERKRRQ